MKACIACKHFSLEMGERGYSTYTPGVGSSVSCNKSVFPYHGMDSYIDPAKDFVEWAKNCPHYTLSQTAIDAGWKLEP